MPKKTLETVELARDRRAAARPVTESHHADVLDTHSESRHRSPLDRRTVGLPQATDDIGNWGETVGIWSLIFEGVMVVLAAVALWPRVRRTPR